MSRRKRGGLVSRLFGTARPGEIYGYRTLRPSRRGPRHWAYVGKTRGAAYRHRQHMGIKLVTDRFDSPGQPWNDLDPKRYVLWKSRRVRGWRLALMELIFIRALSPVYNVQMNIGNPRRIPLRTAERQRRRRDAGQYVGVTVARARWGVQVAFTAFGAILVLVGVAGAILA